jgi:micrococcal nuclease
MSIKKFVRPEFLRWLFGSLFALLSLTYIKDSLIASLSYFLLAVFTLPPFSDIPSSIIKKPISTPVKFLIGFVLLLIAIRFDPNTDKTDPSVRGVNTSAAITITSTPTPQPTATPTPSSESNLYEVVRVVDGDTIVVKIEDKEETIRLIGIDSPESVDPRKSVECFSKEASAKAKELIEGKKITLEIDPTQDDKDKYNRLLRYVFLEDGTFINKKLIEDGYAFEYTYEKPYKYQSEFKEAQKNAEINKNGLWAENACPLTSVPTIKPTLRPQSTKIPISIPTTSQTYVVPVVPNTSGGSYVCDCSKTCPNMSSCAEAQYQLNVCGCQARDGDKDGIACDSDCQ